MNNIVATLDAGADLLVLDRLFYSDHSDLTQRTPSFVFDFIASMVGKGSTLES